MGQDLPSETGICGMLRLLRVLHATLRTSVSRVLLRVAHPLGCNATTQHMKAPQISWSNPFSGSANCAPVAAQFMGNLRIGYLWVLLQHHPDLVVELTRRNWRSLIVGKFPVWFLGDARLL